MKKMLKLKKLAAVILCFSLLSGMLFAASKPRIKENGQYVGPDTYYTNTVIQTDSGSYVVNMVEASTSNAFIKVEVGDSGNPIKTQRVSAQALSRSNDQRRVIGGVNGDFHYTKQYKGIPTGTSVINGEIKTAMGTNAVLGVTQDGQCFIDNLTMTGGVYYQDMTFPVDKVNKPHWYDQVIIYTSAYGAATTSDGNSTEIIVKGFEMPFKCNTLYNGTVEKVITNAKNTPIPTDGIVISGIGMSAKYLAAIPEGAQISFNVNFSNPDVKHVISGLPALIRNGEVVTDEITAAKDAVPKERHPRTAVGIKDGKIVLLTVDGRQRNVSDGMTLYELADYMKGQGITDALNLDGGGSTAMVVRKQGEKLPELANNPSDGIERGIGNTLLIISEAPVSDPSIVAFNQNDVLIYKGSHFKPTFYLMDQYYNALSMANRSINYNAESVGTVSEDGTFEAGAKAASGFFEVTIDSAAGKLPVTVVDRVGSLSLDSEGFNIEPGDKVQLKLKAFDENGRPIIIEPSAVKWSITDKLGVVDENGLFTAGQKKGNGKLSIKIKDKLVEIPARVGKLPLPIIELEDMKNLDITANSAKADARLTKKGEPVKTGKIALKLAYNFEKGSEDSKAIVAFKKPLNILGEPIEVGVWSYGDKAGHWLRGSYINSKGDRKVVNFTEKDKLDWKGWKYTYAEIPKDEAFPIAWEQIYIVEPSEDKKGKGQIYLDGMTVLYKPDKDIYSPELVSASLDAATYKKSPESFSFVVSDRGTGINPASIKLSLNGTTLKPTYNAETGKVYYKIKKLLKKGKYQLKMTVKDKAGNAMLPEFNKTFTIK